MNILKIVKFLRYAFFIVGMLATVNVLCNVDDNHTTVTADGQVLPTEEAVETVEIEIDDLDELCIDDSIDFDTLKREEINIPMAKPSFSDNMKILLAFIKLKAINAKETTADTLSEVKEVIKELTADLKEAKDEATTHIKEHKRAYLIGTACVGTAAIIAFIWYKKRKAKATN